MQEWKNFLNSERPRITPEEFDRQIAEIEAQAREAGMRQLAIGSLQVTNVEPEIKQPDMAVEFDTDVFFKRAPWTKAMPSSYKQARQWVYEKDIGLFLVGGTGAGKTTFFKTLAIELSRKKPFDSNFVKFVNIGKLCDGVSKDSWVAKAMIIDQVSRCQHLFIDDIGTENGYEWEVSLLHKILDNRLHAEDNEGNKKRTYISSNYRVNDLPYHERTLRRIKEAVFEMVVWKPDQHTNRRSNQNITSSMTMEEAQKGF